MLYDDYLQCEAYQNQPISPDYPNITAFYNEQIQRFYFAMLDADGSVLLRSEGYPQEKSCRKGIVSVLKNYKIKKQYSLKEDEGLFYVSLKAANNREIARSCEFSSEVEVNSIVLKLISLDLIVEVDTNFIENLEDESDENISIENIETEVETFENVEANNAGFDFMDSNTFKGHERIWNEYGQTGYAKFYASNKHFFVVYNPDDSIYLHSKGFDSPEMRDAELTEVERYITNEDKYQIIEKDNQYLVVLNDENGNELAISDYYPSFTMALINTPKGREKEITDSLY